MVKHGKKKAKSPSCCSNFLHLTDWEKGTHCLKQSEYVEKQSKGAKDYFWHSAA